MTKLKDKAWVMYWTKKRMALVSMMVADGSTGFNTLLSSLLHTHTHLLNTRVIGRMKTLLGTRV